MYTELIFHHFIKPNLKALGCDWLLQAVHMGIKANGSKITFLRMNSNYKFFYYFASAMSEPTVTLYEKVQMVGDCWNIIFNPHLPLHSEISKL